MARLVADAIIESMASVLRLVSSSEPNAVFIDDTNKAAFSPNVPRSSLPVNQVTTPPIGSSED